MQPELLYLLHGDPAELSETLAGMRAADIAEALHDLPPAAAAKVMAVLAFDLAVQVFDEPELDCRYEIVKAMDQTAIQKTSPLIVCWVDIMYADPAQTKPARPM